MSTTLIVTSPTGVDVELAIAGPGSRAYAFIIDWHIRAILAVVWLLGTAYLLSNLLHFDRKAPTATALIVALPGISIYLLYHPLLELLMRGRTPGKRIAGVRIVNRQGGTPSTLEVLIRNAFRLIDSLPLFYALGLCTALFNEQRSRFGDLAAGTLLVHDGDSETQALSQLGSLSLNPALDASTVALGNDLLLRWKDLHPDSRRRLAHDLLTRIATAAGTTPVPMPENSRDDQQLQQQLRNALSGRAQ
jgi:uncharacterized RDD family membrane protein YckC